MFLSGIPQYKMWETFQHGISLSKFVSQSSQQMLVPVGSGAAQICLRADLLNSPASLLLALLGFWDIWGPQDEASS